MADPDFQVRAHQDRAVIGVGDQLDVLEDRLGAPRGTTPLDHPERREQSLTVAELAPYAVKRLSGITGEQERRRACIPPVRFARWLVQVAVINAFAGETSWS